MPEITATPEELLAFIQRLFPREYEMAADKLTIHKQAALIEQLRGDADSHAHSHSHDEEGSYIGTD